MWGSYFSLGPYTLFFRLTLLRCFPMDNRILEISWSNCYLCAACALDCDVLHLKKRDSYYLFTIRTLQNYLLLAITIGLWVPHFAQILLTFFMACVAVYRSRIIPTAGHSNTNGQFFGVIILLLSFQYFESISTYPDYKLWILQINPAISASLVRVSSILEVAALRDSDYPVCSVIANHIYYQLATQVHLHTVDSA